MTKIKPTVKMIQMTTNPIETIYKAYRICYSKFSFENVKIPYLENGEPNYKDMENFIKPLMAEQHTSPLEHVTVTFSIENLSRAALAQITRHRTFKFNVQSQRYVDGKHFIFITPSLEYVSSLENSTEFDFLSDIASKVNISGRDNESIATEIMEGFFEEARKVYGDLLVLGLKKEDARCVLPQATTCNLVVTMDMNNFRNFLRQRACMHAQTEIRGVANDMMHQVEEHIPFIGYKALLCNQGLCKHCFTKNNDVVLTK